MPKEFARARRVEEQLKRLLAELVRREVKDPRVGLITITAVELSKDLSHARVFFTPFAGRGDAAAAQDALRHAAGYLRHGLRKALSLRVTPQLDFRIDERSENRLVMRLIDPDYPPLKDAPNTKRAWEKVVRKHVEFVEDKLR